MSPGVFRLEVAKLRSFALAVQGFVVRFWALVFGVLRLGVRAAGFRVWGQGVGYRVWGLRFRAWGSELMFQVCSVWCRHCIVLGVCSGLGNPKPFLSGLDVDISASSMQAN